MNNISNLEQEGNRIFSIDFFRGFTMFMLIGGVGELFRNLDPDKSNAVISFFSNQLDHAPWNGLRFWDLIHPFFIFIVGVAMPFSLKRRWDRGESWKKTFYHVLQRCFFLLLIGWAIHSGPTSSDFNNIMAQLAVTYLIAFLVMRKSIKWQLLFSFGLLLATDFLYRYWPVAGFDQQFTADHNFGSWFDMLLTGDQYLKHGQWAPFNAIPSTANTIWGIIVGMLLMKDWSHRKKLRTLLITGIIALIIGYAMDTFIPIIKRTWTFSYAITSGGWCLIGMAVSYWLVDVLRFRKIPLFFSVFGMNPLLIYLLAGSLRSFFGRLVDPFIYRLFSWSGEITVAIISFFVIAAMLWYVCYFLYKHKIFIRL
jgi:predicted acyltransferase